MHDRVCISQTLIDREPTILKAYGLGSCIAVAIHDPESKFGGLGHMLLPKRPEKNPSDSQAKYVDAGICQMVDQLVLFGANRQGLVAKIAGGANMFETTNQSLINSIGARNARSARETLEQHGITLVGEDIGGNRGRSVEFDLATGIMLVYCAHDNRPISL
ncbi:MAG: chemotaxis protein CheD [Desulfuromonadales bacterium]